MARTSVTHHRLVARRRRQAALQKPFHLNLTSMVDMFTIILVFLLVAYTVSDDSTSLPKEIELPAATSQQPSTTSVKLVVGIDQMTFEEKTTIPMSDGRIRPEDGPGLLIIPLYKAMAASYPMALQRVIDSEMETAKGGETPGQPAALKKERKDVSVIVNLLSDKRVPYGTIERILFTAGQAKYNGFHFSVVRKSAGSP